MRIAVMGTRGKTSTAILLYTELRRRGFRVVCKATGALPFLCHDGRCFRIKRRGRTRLYENLEALKLDADFYIMENHGTNPYTMRAFNHFVKPDVVVLTNARLDHTEHMGESKRTIAENMAKAVGKVKLVVMGEDFPIQGVKVFPTEMPGSEVPRLVDLLLKELGLGGIDVSLYDKMISRELRYRDGPVRWFDASKVNDPESFSMIVSWLDEKPNLAIQLRRDRPGRTKVFLNYIRENRGSFGRIAVAGAWASRFADLVEGRSFRESSEGARRALSWLEGPVLTAVNRSGEFMSSFLSLLGAPNGIPTIFGTFKPERICSGLIRS